MISNRSNKVLLPFIFLIIIQLGNPFISDGATFKAGGDYIIDKAVDDNLYSTGGKVRVQAPIKGDLVIAGGQVKILDSVKGNLIITGGNIDVEDYVGGNVLAAGGDVTFSGDIDGDLTLAGGKVAIEKGATIAHDFTITGGNLALMGNVDGKFKSYAGKTDFYGKVRDSFLVKAGEVTINGQVRGPAVISAGKINLGDQADFHKDIVYWSKAGQMDFSEFKKAGASARFEEELASQESDMKWAYLGLAPALYWIYYILSMGLVLIILVWLFNSYFEETANKIRQNFGQSLGYGVLYLIGVPIMTLVLLVTVIGLPVAFVTGILYGLSLLLANAFLAVTLANIINKKYEMKWGIGLNWLVSLLVLIVLKAIGWIPVIGWLIIALAISLFFGGFLSTMLVKPENKDFSQ